MNSSPFLPAAPSTLNVGADDPVRPSFDFPPHPVGAEAPSSAHIFEPILFFLCQKEKNGFNLPRKERGQGANRCPEFNTENFDLYLSVASNPTIRKDSALCASPFGGAAQQDQRLRADEGIGPYRAQCQIKRADRVVRPYKRCGGNRKRGPMKALAPTGCGAKSKRRATNGRPLRLGSGCDRDRRGGHCPPAFLRPHSFLFGRERKEWVQKGPMRASAPTTSI